MDAVHDDRYVVFLRPDPPPDQAFLESAEQLLATCATYQEARRIRRALQGSAAGDCVIRYVGPAGGGD